MKNSKTAIKILAIACSLIANPAFAENWLCIAEQSTGFKYDVNSRKWRSVNFNVKDDKYIVKPNPFNESEYIVMKFGSDNDKYPDFVCKDTFSAGIFFHCKGTFGEFKMNIKNGRFLTTYIAGYWTVAPGVNSNTETGDTPSMEIGTCSKF